MEKLIGSRLKKVYDYLGYLLPPSLFKGYLLPPSLFNPHAEHIMRNAGLDELQAGIKIGRRNISNLRYVGDTTNGRNQNGTKEPLDEGEGGE